MSARTRAASCAIAEGTRRALPRAAAAGGGAAGQGRRRRRRQGRRARAAAGGPEAVGAAPSACIASTAPQIPIQKGRWPWVEYITTPTMKKPVKCPASAAQHAQARRVPRVARRSGPRGGRRGSRRAAATAPRRPAAPARRRSACPRGSARTSSLLVVASAPRSPCLDVVDGAALGGRRDGGAASTISADSGRRGGRRDGTASAERPARERPARAASSEASSSVFAKRRAGSFCRQRVTSASSAVGHVRAQAAERLGVPLDHRGQHLGRRVPPERRDARWPSRGG